MEEKQAPTPSPVQGFNVDEIMRKIDAKIAEIEKEEQAKQEEIRRREEQASIDAQAIKEGKKEEQQEEIETLEQEEPSYKVPVEAPKFSLELDDEDEDDFFDDFFEN